MSTKPGLLHQLHTREPDAAAKSDPGLQGLLWEGLIAKVAASYASVTCTRDPGSAATRASGPAKAGC